MVQLRPVSDELYGPYFPTDGAPLAVIGTGMVGASWAALFASNGWEVHLHDSNSDTLANALETIHKVAQFLVDHAMADANKTQKGLNSLATFQTLPAAVEGATLVQEAVVENLETKRRIFKEIDQHTSNHALLITSSSGLSISQIQASTEHPERCLAGHPYNPPHLIPLVEIAPGESTSPQAVEAARAFYESLGKKPIVLKREIPGYLANRMSAALWREAVNLVLEGVASVEDIDDAIRFGPGLRWSVVGPNLTYHLGGGKGGIRYHTEHLLHSKEKMWQSLKDWKTFPLEAIDILEAGLPDPEDFQSIAHERDRALVRLIKALYE
jgi:3-hydroxypropionate dehydrogenase (NADP+)